MRNVLWVVVSQKQHANKRYKIYLDVCCLNRPFDDQTQPRIRLESEAVLLVLDRLVAHEWEWVCSDAVDFEVRRTPDPERRYRVQVLAAQAHVHLRVGDNELKRAEELHSLGFKVYDALHLACAESSEADVFLTTDDQLLRTARRLRRHLNVAVENPVDWVRHVT